MPRIRYALVAMLASIFALVMLQRVAAAHCDTIDGPVVVAGKQALATGKLDQALIWVPQTSERELRALFKKVVAARKKGASAEVIDLLERYFLETLVRLHRAGEGEPYNGIQPAGTAVDPGIAAADATLAAGTVNHLAMSLSDELAQELRVRFQAVQKQRHWGDLAGGRSFVHAYVEYVHYVAAVRAVIVTRRGSHSKHLR